MKPERVVARLLSWGGMLGVALMVAGVATHVESPHRQSPGGDGVSRVESRVGPPASLDAIHRALREWPPDPLGVADVGIAVILATPIVGVGAAAAAFWFGGDYRYVLVAGTVLAVILMSIAAGRVT